MREVKRYTREQEARRHAVCDRHNQTEESNWTF